MRGRDEDPGLNVSVTPSTNQEKEKRGREGERRRDEDQLPCCDYCSKEGRRKGERDREKRKGR